MCAVFIMYRVTMCCKTRLVGYLRLFSLQVIQLFLTVRDAFPYLILRVGRVRPTPLAGARPKGPKGHTVGLFNTRVLHFFPTLLSCRDFLTFDTSARL